MFPSLLGGKADKISDMSGNIPKGLFMLDGLVSNAPFVQSYGTTGFFIGNTYYSFMFAPVLDSTGLKIYVRSYNASGVGLDWYAINMTKVEV